MPGAAILIARDGQPVWRAALGSARADGTPMTTRTICRIASMTKPMVSLAFMMLVEEGKVSLSDPVTGVIPEFAGLGVYAGGGEAPFDHAPAAAEMRMVDLLTHMSGLTYGIQNRTALDAAYRKARLDGHPSLAGNDHFIAELASLPLEFSPGSRWNYSVGVDVLGVVVSRVSGMSLGDFLRTRICQPLGMADTGFWCPDDKADRLSDAWMHVPAAPPKLIDAAETSGTRRQPRFESGGGGMLSTVEDYHRFCRMLAGRGAADGATLVSPATLRLMTQNHLPGDADLPSVAGGLFTDPENAGTGFGLGFGVTLDPARTLVPGNAGEFFWSGIFGTQFFVDPVEGLHMVFMSQLFPSMAYSLRPQLKTLIYAALAASRA
ncbi:MAG: hypothetical protein RIS94_2575 [Pseudomonadota bacterium]